MICGHCKATEVNVPHVRACAVLEGRVRSIGAPTPHEEMVEKVKKFADTQAAALPLTDLAATEADLTGVYFKDERYYKVQKSGTGNWYAKVWESPLGDGEFEWTYVGRCPIYNLTLNDKATAEQAAQFGHVTGSCIYCARRLTDERSIAVGYGPICADRNGLPWG